MCPSLYKHGLLGGTIHIFFVFVIKLMIVLKEKETNVNVMPQYNIAGIRIENVVVLM